MRILPRSSSVWAMLFLLLAAWSPFLFWTMEFVSASSVEDEYSIAASEALLLTTGHSEWQGPVISAAGAAAFLLLAIASFLKPPPRWRFLITPVSAIVITGLMAWFAIDNRTIVTWKEPCYGTMLGILSAAGLLLTSVFEIRKLSGKPPRAPVIQ